MDEVHVLEVVLGLGTGGAERSTVDLAPHLAAHGVHLHLHCRTQRPVGAQADLDEVDIAFAPDPAWRPWVTDVRRAIRATGADVVHTVLFQADLAGRLAAVGTGAPVLTSLVNTSYDRSRGADPAIRGWKLEATRLLEAASGRLLTQHFHALTPAVAEAAVDRLHVPAGRITVVPRGRDAGRLGTRTAERRAAARAELGVGPDDEVVLHVGRQEYQKAHDTLVRGFAELRRRRPGVRLVMAGRAGNATAGLDRLVGELGVADAIVRPGHVSDVGALFCAADVFAFPSRFEGQGGVLIEAMALACPIVASAIGPIRETVGPDAATLVAPDRPGELAAALDAVLDDPERRAAMGAAGRERFLAEFAIEPIAAAMADLYREVAAAGRGRRGRRR